MLYDILATLWESPAPAEQLHGAVAFRTGVATSAQSLERYLRLLADCGYVSARQRGETPVYAIAERGSALLAEFAQARETVPPPHYQEA
jgi:DNA-binding PadR family transcriptional regulator